MSPRVAFNLEALVDLFNQWDGKHLLDFYQLLERNRPKNGENDIEFRTIVGDFQVYLEDRGYETKQIMPGVSLTSKSKSVLELNKLLNKYRPINRNAITAAIFFSALFKSISEKPLLFLYIITLIFLPIAQAVKAAKCDSSTGACELDAPIEKNNFCDATRVVGRSTIFYSCSQKFKQEKNKKLFRNVVSEMRDAHQEVIERNTAFRCKTEEIAQEKFEIEIVKPDEIDQGYFAQLNALSGKIMFSSAFVNDAKHQSAMEHESHHFWLWSRNKSAGKSKDHTGIIAASLFDSNNPVDFEKYTMALSEDILPILELGHIIQKIESKKSLSSDEKQLWKKYQNKFNEIDLKEKYVPFSIHELTTTESEINRLVLEGYIDKDYNVIKPLTLLYYVELPDHKYAIPMQVLTVTKSNSLQLRVEYGEKTRLYAPIFDSLCMIDRATKYSGNRQVYIEMDTFLHQALEQTKLMFDYLFSHLRKLHEERFTESYRQCLRR